MGQGSRRGGSGPTPGQYTCLRRPTPHGRKVTVVNLLPSSSTRMWVSADRRLSSHSWVTGWVADTAVHRLPVDPCHGRLDIPAFPMLLELIATLCAGFFAGAAAYITLVEHPARLSCGTAL